MATPVPLNIVEGQPQWGYSVSDFQSGQGEQYLSISSVYTNVFFECSGNFTNVCSAGAYQFEFNSSDANHFFSGPNVFLAPGTWRLV